MTWEQRDLVSATGALFELGLIQTCTDTHRHTAGHPKQPALAELVCTGQFDVQPGAHAQTIACICYIAVVGLWVCSDRVNGI